MESTAIKSNKETLEAARHCEHKQSTTSRTFDIDDGQQTLFFQEEIKEFKKTVHQLKLELIDWRQKANYRKRFHQRAVEREIVLKEKVKELEVKVLTLTKQLKGYEELKAKYKLLKKMHFGRKTEQEESNQDSDENTQNKSKKSSLRRGQQPGKKGHGRKKRKELPTEEFVHDLPIKEKSCPKCGLPFEDFSGTEDSDEIHWEVKVIRRVHKRKRYKPTCKCNAVPGIVTAPVIPKIIPKGLFSIGFWSWLILEKFLFQRPLNRIRQVLALQCLHISQGTLTGGLNKIGKLIQPLYAKILERNRSANHWHMDETRWMVFEEIEGKKGHRWWLWVVITKDTCCFILDPSRSADVPKHHLGEGTQGILNADRYSAYKALMKERENIKIAFCWAHVRRDFLRVGKGYKKLLSWSEQWVERINKLFGLNKKRRNVLDKKGKFTYWQWKLCKAIKQMAKELEKELAQEDLHSAQKKVLTSLRNHWEGLIIFVDNPEIPMDNNEAERMLRNAVVGRKNFYGNGAVWSGQLTAALYTILETVIHNNINPQQYLQVYFEACARNNGKAPENIDAFLPWDLSEEVQSALQAKGPSP